MHRRSLLAGGVGTAALLGSGALAPGVARASEPGFTRQRRLQPGPPRITWTIFSRHLQWVTTQAYAMEHPYETGVLVGEAAREMGFGAVDLTVRSGGHVEPSMVGENLAPMLAGVRSAGAICEHITTNIATLGSDFAMDVLNAAADNGVTYYRWGTFRYASDPQGFGDELLDELVAVRKDVRQLAAINHRLGLTAVYHTFSGGRVGSSVWDLVYLLDTIDPDDLAINYDIGHLMTESANGSWRTNTRFAMPNVRSVGLKDSLVSRAANGRVSTSWVPAGEGLVQWEEFFGLLREANFNGPCEAQIEYRYNGVNLNSTFWADSPSFTLTRAEMLSTIGAELAHYRQAASAAGWTPDEQR